MGRLHASAARRHAHPSSAASPRGRVRRLSTGWGCIAASLAVLDPTTHVARHHKLVPRRTAMAKRDDNEAEPRESDAEARDDDGDIADLREGEPAGAAGGATD